MTGSLTPGTLGKVVAALEAGARVGIVARDMTTAARIMGELADGPLEDMIDALQYHWETPVVPDAAESMPPDVVTAVTWLTGTLIGLDLTGVRGLTLGMAVAYDLTPAEAEGVAPALHTTGGLLLHDPPRTAPPAPSTWDRVRAVAHTTAAIVEALRPAVQGAAAAVARAWGTGSTDPDTPPGGAPAVDRDALKDMESRP